MNAKKQFKNDISETYQSNSTFKDIKDRVSVRKSTRVFHFKPLIAFAGAAGLVAIAIGVLTNINSTKTGALAYQISPEVSKQMAIQSAQQKALAPSNAVLPLFKQSTTDNTETEDFTDILYTVDALISNENSYRIKDVNSDREDFANAQVITYTMLNGKEAKYTLYYNDVNSNSQEQKNKSSTETKYHGLAVSDNLELSFIFESKEEVKTNKSNYSSITTIYENEEKTDYLVITSESEEKKNKSQDEYKYQHYTNSILDSSYTVKYDIKQNKETVTVITDNESYVIDKKTLNKKEKFSIKISGENGNQKYSFTKVIEDNGAVDYQED